MNKCLQSVESSAWIGLWLIGLKVSLTWIRWLNLLKLLISQYSNFKNSGEEWALHETDFKKSLAAKVD